MSYVKTLFRDRLTERILHQTEVKMRAREREWSDPDGKHFLQ